MNAKQPSDQGTQRVYGRTLNEALRNVRARWGENARIVDTRTVVRAGSDGGPGNRLVEITVAEPEAPAVEPRETPRRRKPLPQVLERLTRDVERLESLAGTLRRERAAAALEERPDHPLAAILLRRGASPAAVRRLAELRRAEQGPDGGAAAARRHLVSLVRAGGGSWRRLSGQHLVIGPPGSGRTTLVLAAARELATRGRRTLVLAPGPLAPWAVQRLRGAAERDGYDAAVVKDGRGLAAVLPRLDAYDVVLVDGPAVGPGAPADGLAPEDLVAVPLHRHLLAPLDGDPAGRPALWAEARRWACDWIAVGRTDCAPRPGQLLDLLLSAPVPVSLLRAGGGATTQVRLAGAERLVGLLLGADGAEGAGRPAPDDAVAEVTA